MTKILVIGAGVFGIHSAIELAKFGAKITLAEAENDILLGTSGNSILRVHSGFHYPRDIETATQSQNGYTPFLDYYLDCIRLDFNNYYGLARKNSKSNKFQIDRIVKLANIKSESIDPTRLVTTGIDIELLEAAWMVPEGVIDLSRLKLFYLAAIKQNNINLLLNWKIDELNLRNKKWTALSSDGILGEYDFIVRATHGRDSIKSNIETLTNQLYEFHLTSMLEISSETKPFGITVLDGEFITLLPTGAKSRFLVYGPGVSILEKFVGVTPPGSWNNQLGRVENDLIESTINLVDYWFPRIAPYEIIGIRNAIRSVQSGVAKTDRRVTQVSEIAPNFYDIKSTKIDHVIEVGHLLVWEILTTKSA